MEHQYTTGMVVLASALGFAYAMDKRIFNFMLPEVRTAYEAAAWLLREVVRLAWDTSRFFVKGLGWIASNLIAFGRHRYSELSAERGSDCSNRLEA